MIIRGGRTVRPVRSPVRCPSLFGASLSAGGKPGYLGNRYLRYLALFELAQLAGGFYPSSPPRNTLPPIYRKYPLEYEYHPVTPYFRYGVRALPVRCRTEPVRTERTERRGILRNA